ncbi:MAG: flippase-like domain-containing protein [Chloroflexi bacterium]|nr:flippase-like domain-containing protein [Chloroflexota bacterium]
MNIPFWKTHWFRVTIGTLISLVFLILAIQGVPLDQVFEALTRVNYFWILLAVGGMVMQSWLRTVRWVELYYPEQKGLRAQRMLGIVFISQMLNVIVPWRMGEVARIYLMGEVEKKSRTQTLATLGVEKLFDTLMMFLILLLIPPFMTLPDWLERPREGFILLTLAFCAAAVVLLIFQDRFIKLLSRFHLPWSKKSIGEITSLAFNSLDVLKRWDLHLWLQILSITISLLGVTVNFFVFWALGLNLPPISGFLLFAVLQVGGIVPSSPGKVGVFQALCILTLALFGVDKSIGLTYGILLYLVALGTPVVLGVLSLWWGGVNLQRITTAQSEVAQ